LDEGCGEQELLLNDRLAGFLRRALASSIQLRIMPRLRFVHDESIARGEYLSHLIEEAVASEGADADDG
jgi:ribosome-binding factor A